MTLEQPEQPLPFPDDDSAPLWTAAQSGYLALQRCSGCLNYLYYPRALCPKCGSDRITWERASGRGTIYSYTVVHRAPAEFISKTPYVIALIDLAEDVRILSRLVDCDPQHIRIGMEVLVDCRAVTAEIALPFFRLAEDGGTR